MHMADATKDDVLGEIDPQVWFDAVDRRMAEYDPKGREKMGRSYHIECFLEEGFIDPDTVGYVETRVGKTTDRTYYDPADPKAFRSAEEVKAYLAEQSRVFTEEYLRWSGELASRRQGQ